MNIHIANKIIVPQAIGLFSNDRFVSDEAVALIHAIALQESDYRERQQLSKGSSKWWDSTETPAVSFWQFENIGTLEVLGNRATRSDALSLLELLGYPEHLPTIRAAMVNNDFLAAGFARLALWRHPDPLPSQFEEEKAWEYYLKIWAPGKPKRERWDERYKLAWETVLNAKSRVT